MHVLVLTIEWSYYVHGTNTIMIAMDIEMCEIWGFYGGVAEGEVLGSLSAYLLETKSPSFFEASGNAHVWEHVNSQTWDSYRAGFLTRLTTAAPEGGPCCMESLSLVRWLRRVFSGWLYRTSRLVCSFSKRWLIYCVAEKLPVTRQTILLNYLIFR